VSYIHLLREYVTSRPPSLHTVIRGMAVDAVVPAYGVRQCYDLAFRQRVKVEANVLLKDMLGDPARPNKIDRRYIGQTGHHAARLVSSPAAHFAACCERRGRVCGNAGPRRSQHRELAERSLWRMLPPRPSFAGSVTNHMSPPFWLN